MSELRVGAEQIARYAEISGDRNPLHLDEAYAIAQGFDGVIAHGPIALGAVAEELGEDLAGTRVDVRFRGPVLAGDTIACEARETIEGAGREALALAVEGPRGRVLDVLVTRRRAPRDGG